MNSLNDSNGEPTDTVYTSVEVTSTNVTPGANEIGDTAFFVVAAPQKLIHKQFQITAITVAIRGPDMSGGRLLLSIWHEDRFVHTAELCPTPVSRIPDPLSRSLDGTKFDRAYYFELNPDYLPDSWCSILASNPVDEKTECVLRLADFLLQRKSDEP